MVTQVPSLVQLIQELQKIPYLASKNLYTVTDYFLQLDIQRREHFCKIIQNASRVQRCGVCFFWVEDNSFCQFCLDEKRSQTVVCVVETWQDLLSIEKTKAYDGVYHILGGSISPLEGIGPENLTIGQLVDRVLKYKITEVILATNQTPEGEATAIFIARSLHKTGVAVTCLARGLPVGSSLVAIDRVTVHKALSERRPF